MPANLNRMAESIARSLRNKIKEMPDGFYGSYSYTYNRGTDFNRCHPMTLGLLFGAVSKLAGVAHVGIDVRLRNPGSGKKIQPDLVGFKRKNFNADSMDWEHLVYVDFESPNSSDMRVFAKDIKQFGEFIKDKDNGEPTPYIIVTSLPNRKDQHWKFQWPGLYGNDGHKGKIEVIRKNPFKYFQKEWREKMKGWSLPTVAFININGPTVEDPWYPAQ